MKLTGAAVIYALVALTTVLGSLLAVVFVLGGPPDVVMARAAIITSAVGPAIGVLILLLNQGHLAEQQAVQQTMLNGHLDEHKGHTDQQIADMIDQRLHELQAPPAPPQQPPS